MQLAGWSNNAELNLAVVATGTRCLCPRMTLECDAAWLLHTASWVGGVGVAVIWYRPHSGSFLSTGKLCRDTDLASALENFRHALRLQPDNLFYTLHV